MTQAGGPGSASETRVPGAPPRSEIPDWLRRFGLVAGITERSGDEPFNLGLATDEPAAKVTDRWREFRGAMHPSFSAFHVAHQVHGRVIAWHDGPVRGWHVVDGVDGHATDRAGVLLCVTVADCVPVYLARNDGSAWALLHAGWRGLAAGMLEAGVRLLADRKPAVSAAEVAAHLGVAICGSCYEVGPEVAEAVTGSRPGGRMRLDLRAELARRAEALGVLDCTVSSLCTSCHRGRFFSHRASGGSDGRCVAYIGRPVSLPRVVTEMAPPRLLRPKAP